ncbi:MAG: response regulator [Elusimicrobia bacterium]|nr:response regulator [Elusimicrobiota bacterium]
MATLEKLVAYINHYKAQYPVQALKGQLLKQGIPESEIDQAIRLAMAMPASGAPQPGAATKPPAPGNPTPPPTRPPGAGIPFMQQTIPPGRIQVRPPGSVPGAPRPGQPPQAVPPGTRPPGTVPVPGQLPTQRTPLPGTPGAPGAPRPGQPPQAVPPGTRPPGTVPVPGQLPTQRTPLPGTPGAPGAPRPGQPPQAAVPQGAQPPGGQSPAAPAQPGGATPAKPPPGRTYILVVDDDQLIRDMMVNKLEGAGYRVTCAEDAAQSVIQAEGMRLALIISDIEMPGFGTGVDALKKLRASSFVRRNLPVIFVTGMPAAEARKVVPKTDPYVRLLHKPVDWKLLRQYIKDLTGLDNPLD